MNTAKRSCFSATWFALLFVLCGWIQLSNSAQAGCFPGDDYHQFHHGFGINERQLLDEEKRFFFSYSKSSWIFENGDLQPLHYPFEPKCDGPGCRSNPLEGHWGQSTSQRETTRVVYVIDVPPTSTSRNQNNDVRSPGRDETPCMGATLTIDRPPKAS